MKRLTKEQRATLKGEFATASASIASWPSSLSAEVAGISRVMGLAHHALCNRDTQTLLSRAKQLAAMTRQHAPEKDLWRAWELFLAYVELAAEVPHAHPASALPATADPLPDPQPAPAAPAVSQGPEPRPGGAISEVAAGPAEARPVGAPWAELGGVADAQGGAPGEAAGETPPIPPEDEVTEDLPATPELPRPPVIEIEEAPPDLREPTPGLLFDRQVQRVVMGLYLEVLLGLERGLRGVSHG